MSFRKILNPQKFGPSFATASKSPDQILTNASIHSSPEICLQNSQSELIFSLFVFSVFRLTDMAAPRSKQLLDYESI